MESIYFFPFLLQSATKDPEHPFKTNKRRFCKVRRIREDRLVREHRTPLPQIQTSWQDLCFLFTSLIYPRLAAEDAGN